MKQLMIRGIVGKRSLSNYKTGSKLLSAEELDKYVKRLTLGKRADLEEDNEEDDADLKKKKFASYRWRPSYEIEDTKPQVQLVMTNLLKYLVPDPDTADIS